MTAFDLSSITERLQDADDERELIISAVQCGRLPLDLNGLEPEDFADELHALVFRGMLHIQSAGRAISKDALIEWLRADPEAREYPAWAKYLATCDAETIPALGNIVRAQRIHELARRRRMFEAAQDLLRQALEIDVPLPPEEAASGSRRIVVRSAADALLPRPPIEWIIPDLVGRGSLSIFYGEPGSKKTYSMLWMAVCAARGAAWLGFPTTSSRVLFVDEESGESRLSARLAQALHGSHAEASVPIRYVSMAGLRLNDPADAARLSVLIQEVQAELVIIDCLAAITSGDENSKQEVQPVMTALRNMADQTGAAIVLIHHSGKNGVYRGSSAYKASADLLVHVTSEDGSPYVNFRTEKNRDGLAMRWAAKATWVQPDDWSESLFRMEAAEAQHREKGLAPTKQFVLDYLRAHGESPLIDIVTSGTVDAIGSAKAMRNAVTNLTEDGLICRTNGEERGRNVRARYALREFEQGIEEQDGAEFLVLDAVDA